MKKIQGIKQKQIIPKIFSGARALIIGLALFVLPTQVFAVTQQEINNLKSERSIVTGQKLTLQGQVNALNSQIYALQSQINSAQSKINSLTIKIDQTNAEIAKAQAEMTERKIQLSEVVSIMYEDGQQSNIELIAKSKSFSEFVNRSEYVEVMQLKLKETADKILVLKGELEKKKEEIIKEKLEIETSKVQLQSASSAIIQQRQDKDSLLAATKGEESAYNKIIAQKQQQFINEQVSKGGSSTYIPGKKGNIFTFPTRGGRITQGYGMTEFASCGGYGNCTYGGSIHNGIDVGIAANSLIYSIGHGTVIGVGYSPSGGWGNWVMVKHDNGFVSLYAHMISSAYVHVGQEVEATTAVGGIGGTPYWPIHLHFSLYSGNPGVYSNGPGSYAAGTVDPLDYMAITISTSGADWDPTFRH